MGWGEWGWRTAWKCNIRCSKFNQQKYLNLSSPKDKGSNNIIERFDRTKAKPDRSRLCLLFSRDTEWCSSPERCRAWAPISKVRLDEREERPAFRSGSVRCKRRPELSEMPKTKKLLKYELYFYVIFHCHKIMKFWNVASKHNNKFIERCCLNRYVKFSFT